MFRFRSLVLLGLAACAQAAPEGPVSAPPPAPPPSPVSMPETDPPAAPSIEEPPLAPEPVPDPGFSDDELARIDAVQALVAEAAQAYGLDPNLLNGLIWVESRFRVRARGPAGARGIMQIMPRTGKSIARRIERRYRPYDPAFGIHAGAYYLDRMVDRFDGDEALGLAAYNRGPGTVAGWQSRGEPIPERTQAFVDRVLAARARFDALAALRAQDGPSRDPQGDTDDG